MKLEFRLKKTHDRARVPSKVDSVRPLAALLGRRTVVIASSAMANTLTVFQDTKG